MIYLEFDLKQKELEIQAEILYDINNKKLLCFTNI